MDNCEFCRYLLNLYLSLLFTYKSEYKRISEGRKLLPGWQDFLKVLLARIQGPSLQLRKEKECTWEVFAQK